MLPGRQAPPPSPAMMVSTVPTHPQPTTAAQAQTPPISRRNSFARETATSIAQLRQSFDERTHHRLQFPDPVTPLEALSPRRSSSFSFPSPSKPDSTTTAKVLRSIHSDLQFHAVGSRVPMTTSIGSTTPKPPDDLDTMVPPEDFQTVDSPPASPTSSSHSSGTSAHSPVSPTPDHGPDAFEAWLQESPAREDADFSARGGSDGNDPNLMAPTAVTSHPTAASTAFSDELSEWLFRERTSSFELSKAVQKIESDIRVAIDSAASRVSQEIQRRDQFEQQLRAAAGTLPGSSSDAPQPREDSVEVTPSGEHPSEPELLLLMEVLITPDRSETIEVHVGDEPEVLAMTFAAKHGLGDEAIPRLTQHIHEQLDALREEEALAGGGVQDNEDPWLGTPGSHLVDSSINDDKSVPGASVEASSLSTTDPPVLAEPQPRSEESEADRRQREYEREHNYNTLMEKYGHYTSHSGKVNPGTMRHQTLAGDPRDVQHDDEPLTMRNVEHTRLMFTRRTAAECRPTGKNKDTVYNRLYALAESKEKWIRRQQKAKAAEEMKEHAQMKLEISAKSRDLIANRTNGGYAHIGERLYEEALSDLAKKERERERRALEREQEVDWTCPKCAFVNHANDEVCKNVVAALPPSSSTPTLCVTGVGSGHASRRDSQHTLGGLQECPEVVCGHARPEKLFQPTLLTAPPCVERALSLSKQRSQKLVSQRRQRNQQAMEDEFRQTCPFKPRINDVSEDIMREKLEHEAKAAGVNVTLTPSGTIRRQNPHQALYEDAFHTKAMKEAKEQEYLRQFSFKPNIGVNTLWLSGERASESDVVERLAVTKYQELERKRQALHEKYAQDRDPRTGREYFKPDTGRGPIFNRNERGLPIGDFLYEANKEREEYHRQLVQREVNHIKQQQQQGFLSETSKQALAARKKKTFTRIFDYLRSLGKAAANTHTGGEEDASSNNGKGNTDVVDPAHISTQDLLPEVARVVAIVFEFADHAPFTYAQFEGFMEKLIAEVPGLTYTQMLFLTENIKDGRSARRSVDPPNRRETEDRELTFRPAIDRNSKALAQKHGRAERAKVFTALNQYFEHYRERKELARKQQEREFARTHPFQPMFCTKDRKTRGAKFYSKLEQGEMESSFQPNPSGVETALRTAVPNARPCVRPIDPHDSGRHSRSSSRQFDEEDDLQLTSRVLAALDDRRHSGAVPPPPAPQSLTSTTSASSAVSMGTAVTSSAPAATLSKDVGNAAGHASEQEPVASLVVKG